MIFIFCLKITTKKPLKHFFNTYNFLIYLISIFDVLFSPHFIIWWWICGAKVLTIRWFSFFVLGKTAKKSLKKFTYILFFIGSIWFFFSSPLLVGFINLMMNLRWQSVYILIMIFGKGNFSEFTVSLELFVIYQLFFIFKIALFFLFLEQCGIRRWNSNFLYCDLRFNKICQWF